MSLPMSAAWRLALPGLLSLIAALFFLYWDTALAMVTIWNRSETFAHAFVVPPLALWLIWRQRAVLAVQQPRPAPLFLLPMALFAGLWLIGDLAAVNAATQLAFTAMLVLTVPLALGTAVARSIAFPLGFLFFAVPFGEFMMPQLMAWTADFTVMALRASGIPVYREALHFIIPSGAWSVVEACSGIRYLMASVMVGTLFAYLNYRSLKRRWIFVGVAVALPLVANWLRAYLIVIGGHLSDNKIAAGADHLIYGWVFFGIIMLAMFMIGARWSEPDAQQSGPWPAAAPVPNAVRAGAGWPTIAAALILLVAPQLILGQTQADAVNRPLSLVAPDLSAQGWAATPESSAVFSPVYENPAADLQAHYRHASGATVSLFVAYYRHQSYDSKLISSTNVLLRSDSTEWSQAMAGKTLLPVSSGDLSIRVAELRAAALATDVGLKRLRVWHLFWVNGRTTSSDWQAKLIGAVSRLLGRGDDSAVLLIYADKAVAGEDDQMLAGFMRDNWTSLDAWLQRVRDAGQSTNSTEKGK
jgi:exosortase A